MQEVVDRAIQAHGALGISDDTVLSWFYRQERAARIYDGPDEVHKAVVAKRILKQHGLSLLEIRGYPPPIHEELDDERLPIDDTRPVRDGEQLDVARLRDYLAAHLPAAGGTARRSSNSRTGTRT